MIVTVAESQIVIASCHIVARWLSTTRRIMRGEITRPESDKLIYHPSVGAVHYLCLQPEGDNVKTSVH